MLPCHIVNLSINIAATRGVLFQDEKHIRSISTSD